MVSVVAWEGLSRGPRGCEAGIYTDVAGWKDFIIETALEAAAKGGYAPPFWTNGSSIPPPPPPDAGPANPDTECATSDECGENGSKRVQVDVHCAKNSSRPGAAQELDQSPMRGATLAAVVSVRQFPGSLLRGRDAAV